MADDAGKWEGCWDNGRGVGIMGGMLGIMGGVLGIHGDVGG